MSNMKIKKGTIKEIQEYVREKTKERGFGDDPLAVKLLLLSEEVGELIHASRRHLGMNFRNKIKDTVIGEELSDILYMVFSIANKLGIDMEKELIKKENKNDKRIYKKVRVKIK
jgi:NTP pyrophosphatase (non-canonical NTP hydrolase)